ncbi:DUF4440 domain-containing protein [Emticicia sp. CRIBPO]|uniref:nuclear transport factor 2 family protein n=1 Tax=Emticicia sp. CRIBPO TaxID=2683258 RepID=UPI001411EB3E|nr:nuclear transport factor 2 family protein [Emticicia sp. CRIBPO]NBA88360.1 DUF4440 domain-containing protein [Emticicia sp. CRIBPO]
MTKEAIILHEEKLLNAIKSSDLDVLNQLLHDDLLFIIPGGQTITKAMDMANYASGNMSVNSLEADDMIINLIDKEAVVSVQINLKGKYLDQVIDGRFRYLRVWKEFNGHFMVIGGSCNVV